MFSAAGNGILFKIVLAVCRFCGFKVSCRTLLSASRNSILQAEEVVILVCTVSAISYYIYNPGRMVGKFWKISMEGAGCKIANPAFQNFGQCILSVIKT